jgi:perosamine synthetase
MLDRISVAAPTLLGNEKKYVMECLDTTWISSLGRFIQDFEIEFSRFCGVRNGIATNNGTTALHLALVGLGIGPGDEVIVPTVTYIASANAVRYCGATPVLVDVVPETLVIDPEQMLAAITEKTKAVIPVHLYGQPADMTTISSIAAEHGIYVLEDSAEAHGAQIGDARVGSFGHVGMFSFFGNKIITTGEGGMLVTDDDDLAARLRLYRGQGMDPARRYWFNVVGYNYRMTNIQAAIGLAQFERIDQVIARRASIAAAYAHELADLNDHFLQPAVSAGTSRADWTYNIFLRDGGEDERGAVMRTLDAAAIETRPVFYPLHQMPPYASEALFPVADAWACRGISLPMHEGMTDGDVSRIAAALRLAVAEL